MRRIIIVITLVALVALLVVAYLGLTMTTIVAEQVTGTSHCGHNCYAIITKSTKEIPSTNIDVSLLSEDSRLDTVFIVIYEEKRWLKSKTRFIQLHKFQRSFTEDDYASYTSLDYAKLVEESIKSMDRDHMIMTRVYELHHKHDRTIDLLPESIITPALATPQDVKDWIAEHDPDFLKLRPLTVVDSELSKQWEREQYTPLLEYSNDSPEGLTFKQIVNMGKKPLTNI